MDRDTPTKEPIKVTSRILIHIGAGIYSTPGNALKELISNSFDADATEVQLASISTVPNRTNSRSRSKRSGG